MYTNEKLDYSLFCPLIYTVNVCCNLISVAWLRNVSAEDVIGLT